MGDGHQPNSSGLYTHYEDSVFKVGWVYPQYKELINPGIAYSYTAWLFSPAPKLGSVYFSRKPMDSKIESQESLSRLP